MVRKLWPSLYSSLVLRRSIGEDLREFLADNKMVLKVSLAAQQQHKGTSLDRSEKGKRGLASGGPRWLVRPFEHNHSRRSPLQACPSSHSLRSSYPQSPTPVTSTG